MFIKYSCIEQFWIRKVVSKKYHVIHKIPRGNTASMDQWDHKQSGELYLLWGDKWSFVLVQGETILISDHYWNSLGYYLHDSDICLVQYENIQPPEKKGKRKTPGDIRRAKGDIKQIRKPLS